MTLPSITVVLAAFLVATQALSQDAGDTKLTAPERRMCAATICQHNVRVTLHAKGGKLFDKTFNVLPGIVQPIGLTIVAGQTIHVEASIADGKLSEMVAVAAVVDPEKTITASLEQTDDGGMMLIVKNPFNVTLKFNLGMMPLDAEKIFSTSSCPLVPKGSIYEMWPYPIFQIVIGNGHVLEDTSKAVCEN